jgi:effector-binding domain-containing protein
MAELDSAYPLAERTGPPGGCYANELFTDGIGELTVYHPVRRPESTGNIERLELDQVELAVTTHTGTHDDIDITYGHLGAWVIDHALAIHGPIHETYLVGPRDTPDTSTWRTEIGWPIFRVGS